MFAAEFAAGLLALRIWESRCGCTSLIRKPPPQVLRNRRRAKTLPRDVQCNGFFSPPRIIVSVSPTVGPEVLNALVLRIFLSRRVDRLYSLLADQGRRYQNFPAPRAERVAHPEGL